MTDRVTATAVFSPMNATRPDVRIDFPGASGRPLVFDHDGARDLYAALHRLFGHYPTDDVGDALLRERQVTDRLLDMLDQFCRPAASAGPWQPSAIGAPKL